MFIPVIVIVINQWFGVYSRRLEYFLQQEGLNYHILNPLVAKNRITTGSRLRKNDKRDARRLAVTEFMEHQKPYLLAYKQDRIYRELTLTLPYLRDKKSNGNW